MVKKRTKRRLKYGKKYGGIKGKQREKTTTKKILKYLGYKVK